MKILYAESMNDDYGALFTVVEYPKNTNISTKKSISNSICATLSHDTRLGYYSVVMPSDKTIKSLVYETQTDEDMVDYEY